MIVAVLRRKGYVAEWNKSKADYQVWVAERQDVVTSLATTIERVLIPGAEPGEKLVRSPAELAGVIPVKMVLTSKLRR